MNLSNILGTPNQIRDWAKFHTQKSNVLFVCNHSGGKDSQAMFHWMHNNIPHNQMVVVHAHLPEVEWEGTIEHIYNTTFDIPTHVVQANKTFFEMVDRRGMWPSPSFRQCTSDLKIVPISKFIRNYTKDHNYSIVFNCLGLRSEESTNRSKQPMIKINKKLTTKKRIVFDFLPIQDFTLQDVFLTYNVTLKELNNRRLLYKSNQQEALDGFPFIWTYVAGMSRHSCKICIMSKKSDLCCSANIDPTNAIKYIVKEKEIDHTFIMPKNGKRKFLDQIITEISSQTSLF